MEEPPTSPPDKPPAPDKAASEQDMDPEESAAMGRPRAGEPLLVEEAGPSCPPAHVARLLASVRGEPRGQPLDELVALLYVLAVESGFTPLHSEDPFSPGWSARNLRCISRMPRDWRRPGPRYKLDFALLHPAGPWSARLVGVACGGDLIVNMVAAEPACVAFSHAFAPRDAADPAALARRFKEAVCLPVRAAVLNERGLCNASLAGLPRELQLQVAAQLQPQDLYHLALSCRAMADLVADQSLWRGLVRRDLPHAFKELATPEVGGDPVDWRTEYRKRRPAPPPQPPSRLEWPPWFRPPLPAQPPLPPLPYPYNFFLPYPPSFRYPRHFFDPFDPPPPF